MVANCEHGRRNQQPTIMNIEGDDLRLKVLSHLREMYKCIHISFSNEIVRVRDFSWCVSWALNGWSMHTVCFVPVCSFSHWKWKQVTTRLSLWVIFVWYSNGRTLLTNTLSIELLAHQTERWKSKQNWLKPITHQPSPYRIYLRILSNLQCIIVVWFLYKSALFHVRSDD